MKKGFVIGITVFTIVMLILAILMRVVPDGRAQYRIKKIGLYGGQKELYLKAKYWGTQSGNSVTVLAEDDSTPFEVDGKLHYIYNGPDFIFYRAHADTLWMYVRHRSIVPTKFRKDIRIIQVKLNNQQMIQMKATRYYQDKRVAEF